MYNWPGMRKVTQCTAISLYGKKPVFLLYDDNTESEATSLEEIANHFGEYGIHNEYAKTIKIPVNYIVETEVEVTAESEEEALEYLKTYPFDYEISVSGIKVNKISICKAK